MWNETLVYSCKTDPLIWTWIKEQIIGWGIFFLNEKNWLLSFLRREKYKGMFYQDSIFFVSFKVLTNIMVSKFQLKIVHLILSVILRKIIIHFSENFTGRCCSTVLKMTIFFWNGSRGKWNLSEWLNSLKKLAVGFTFWYFIAKHQSSNWKWNQKTRSQQLFVFVFRFFSSSLFSR